MTEDLLLSEKSGSTPQSCRDKESSVRITRHTMGYWRNNGTSVRIATRPPSRTGAAIATERGTARRAVHAGLSLFHQCASLSRLHYTSKLPLAVFQECQYVLPFAEACLGQLVAASALALVSAKVLLEETSAFD